MQFEPYVRWLLPLFALVIAFFVGLGVTTPVADVPAVAQLRRA